MRFSTFVTFASLCCATFGVVAFPTAPPPAFLNVTPTIPAPGDHVVISVYDTTESGIQGFGPITDVTIVQTGNSFRVRAQLGYIGADTDPRGPGILDLGQLAPGRYTVDYASTNGVLPNLHQATLEFSVSQEFGIATAVEFYDPQRDHYFQSSNPVEIAALDNGTTPGWRRTGQSFHVLPTDTMPSNANPVCRLYGLPAAGLDSHFFSDDPTECQAVLRNWPKQWIEESPAVFGTPLRFDCIPLYRLYNNRPDANHRYTTSIETRDQMVALGWTVEGSLYTGHGDATGRVIIENYAMCVPP